MFKSDIYVGCTGLLKRGGSESPDKPVGTFFIQSYIKTSSTIIGAYLKEIRKKN